MGNKLDFEKMKNIGLPATERKAMLPSVEWTIYGFIAVSTIIIMYKVSSAEGQEFSLYINMIMLVYLFSGFSLFSSWFMHNTGKATFYKDSIMINGTKYDKSLFLYVSYLLCTRFVNYSRVYGRRDEFSILIKFKLKSGETFYSEIDQNYFNSKIKPYKIKR
ncbi:MAG: hypothetical protein LBM38_01810 [Clostridiales bacterium]|jgi:hypothetical protein|nr:hypothetical protein [Clostridiales bacterium]